jgi:hypothetical protein
VAKRALEKDEKINKKLLTIAKCEKNFFFVLSSTTKVPESIHSLPIPRLFRNTGNKMDKNDAT